jgi:hypothetical protein
MDFLTEIVNKGKKVGWTPEILKLFPQEILENKISELIINSGESRKNLLYKESKKMGFPIINGFLYNLNKLLKNLFEEYNHLKKTKEYFIYCLLQKKYSMRISKRVIIYSVKNPESIYEIIYSYKFEQYYKEVKFKNIRKYHKEKNKENFGYSFHSLNEEEFKELVDVLYHYKKKQIRKRWRIAIFKVLLGIYYTRLMRFKINSSFYNYKWTPNIKCTKYLLQ